MIPICPVSRFCAFLGDLSRYIFCRNPNNTAQLNRNTDISPVTDHQSAAGDFLLYDKQTSSKYELLNKE